jgi:ABC-2 type transport system ATP-binding protein
LKELIIELGKSGKILIVSSHILPELADFCNTVGIIERGDLLAFGPVDQVVREHRPVRIIDIRVMENAPAAKRAIASLPGVLDAQSANGHEIKLDFNGDLEAQAEIVNVLIRDGFKVLSFHEEHGDLEDVFLKLTKGAVN